MADDPSDEVLYEGRYLTLQSRDGWEFVHRRHPVTVIVAWTPDDELLLVEQFRVPLGRRTIELPAGLVGDDLAHGNEDMLDAAARELEEETGWRPGQLEEIMSCPISAGLTDESVLFVRATELLQVSRGGGDESEDIVVHRIRRSAIDEWLAERYANGLAIDPKIFAALYWSLSG
ncbi:MAG: NUDIX hydrolase [Wenzhouxiangella sp.]|jgi:ADP-ribose pyrophosphatase|nr:NUDIX hydrolase [Wenzhouxiangella sp.]